MTDPWDDFAADAIGAACAGYIERGDAPGLAGRWSVSFVDPVERLVLRPQDDAARLDVTTQELLRGSPGGALIGYVGFDATSLFEPLLRSVPSGSPFPLGEWAFVRNARRRRVRDSPARAARTDRRPPTHPPVADTLSRSAYERGVRRLRHAIGEGEAFQVVLSHRRAWPRPTDLLSRAGQLRHRERFAYFYYLKFGDREIVGASPESVLEVTGGRAFVSPIAGTRPRGASARGRRVLSEDPKELAEHRMLVDLARNDLGRIARPGRVRLVWRERTERFAQLEHMITRVEARLRPDVGPWTALAATFPAGTVSGAPKIRSTQLLRREERSWRGPYGGAVGLVGRDGTAAWALAIRTAFAAGDRLYTAAGAGIVWPSEPRREYLETLTKLAEVEASLVEERSG